MRQGGALVGYKKNNGDVNISLASGPGQKAKKSATGFEKDIEFCQSFINENYKKCGDKGIYVGEWHYHPSKCNKPSNTDLLSLSNIAVQKEYLTEKPIIIIYSEDRMPSCTVHPANKKYYFSNFQVT